MGIVSTVRRKLHPDELIEARQKARIEYLRSRRAPRTIESLEYLYRVHVRPAFGGLLLEEVTAAAVADWHSDVGRTAPVAANRALSRVLSALYRWLQKRGEYVGPNPCSAVEPFDELPRTRRATHAEMRALYSALDEISASSEARRIAVACFWFIRYTGLRRGQALNLRWDQAFDDRLEFQRTKGQYHMRFISRRARRVLDSMPQISDRVFPVSLSTLRRVWSDAREIAGCPDLWRHDLRRTYESRLGDTGLSEGDIGAHVGQSRVVCMKHYRHLSADRLREIAERGGELMADEEEAEKDWAPAGTSR